MSKVILNIGCHINDDNSAGGIAKVEQLISHCYDIARAKSTFAGDWSFDSFLGKTDEWTVEIRCDILQQVEFFDWVYALCVVTSQDCIAYKFEDGSQCGFVGDHPYEKFEDKYFGRPEKA